MKTIKLVSNVLMVITVVGLVASNVYLIKELKECKENQLELVAAVDKLEGWVETSSVQGKLNGYKRQMGAWKAKMINYYNKAKGNIGKKSEPAKK
jgi:hypothetical protein